MSQGHFTDHIPYICDMTLPDEGYIKYTGHFTDADLPIPVPATLLTFRDQLHDVQLIGIYPDGIGYGNISMRSGEGSQFIISGTRTGGIYPIKPEDFCLVTEVDIDRNIVYATGRVEASSESMTHAACYLANPEIQMVIHIHHPGMWHMYMHQHPTVAETITYGTPEMAFALMQLTQNTSTLGCIIAAGHTDGIFIYGPSPEVTMHYCLDLYHNWSANKG